MTDALPTTRLIRVDAPVEGHEGVALVTIDRPEALNALSFALLAELADALETLDQDGRTRVAVVTGAGDRAFAAGADIVELADQTPERLRAEGQFGSWDRIGAIGIPLIAAVRGFALGGGCELAMACHLRVASETAKFGQPEVKLGIGPGYGGTVRLPRLVGKGRALELLLTGQMIDAQEAWRIGLVNRVVPADRLLDEAEQLLRSILENGPLAIRACLEAVDAGLEMSLDQALLLEANHFGLLSGTRDMREGTRAFLEKRKPVFQGE